MHLKSSRFQAIFCRPQSAVLSLSRKDHISLHCREAASGGGRTFGRLPAIYPSNPPCRELAARAAATSRHRLCSGGATPTLAAQLSEAAASRLAPPPPTKQASSGRGGELSRRRRRRAEDRVLVPGRSLPGIASRPSSGVPVPFPHDFLVFSPSQSPRPPTRTHGFPLPPFAVRPPRRASCSHPHTEIDRKPESLRPAAFFRTPSLNRVTLVLIVLIVRPLCAAPLSPLFNLAFFPVPVPVPVPVSLSLPLPLSSLPSPSFLSRSLSLSPLLSLLSLLPVLLPSPSPSPFYPFPHLPCTSSLFFARGREKFVLRARKLRPSGPARGRGGRPGLVPLCHPRRRRRRRRRREGVLV